jgi:hypothetical protein
LKFTGPFEQPAPEDSSAILAAVLCGLRVLRFGSDAKTNLESRRSERISQSTQRKSSLG